jgi:hypothetical protein
MKIRLLMLPLLLLLAAPVLTAVEVPSGDSQSTVPELVAFHEIIYPIWHTAYPTKDYAALRSYLPEVNRLAEKILSAKLPGILREKQGAWEKGLLEFKKTVQAYNEAVAGKDDGALLPAAENLHGQFEAMVRIIRPVLKEMDGFHQVLYIIYHQYLPEKNQTKISEVSSDLLAKARAISAAALPKRLEAKTKEFQLAAAKLLDQTQKLHQACLDKQPAVIDAAVEAVHTAYVALQSVFE